MEFDLNKKHCYYFNEILKIPHGSCHEKALSDWIVRFAKDRDLEVKQDEQYNVIVYKKGSKGREEEPAILLQAHIDMVCEKNNDVDFDFEKLGIETVVKEDWLYAKGTTLGADDGAGVSYILAILDDDTLSHPPVVGVFTTMEEIGLVGAKSLKAEDMRAHRMINLDGGGEVETTISNSGGQRCLVKTAIDFVSNAKPCFRIFITGLKGGHSGGMIHLNRANSNKVMGRVLNTLLSKSVDFDLVNINGGLKENAIPRECEAYIACDKNLNEIIDQIEMDIQADYAESDNIKISLEACDPIDKAMTKDSAKNVIRFIECSPNGFIAPSLAIPGLTLTSLNMGVVRTGEDHVEYRYSIRSPLETARKELMEQLEALACLTNGKLEAGAAYPGWVYEKESRLRSLLADVLMEKEGKELVCKAAHGGLETGFFKAMVPDMDIITYGPIAFGCHTPEEKLDLASFDRSFEILKECLRRM